MVDPDGRDPEENHDFKEGYYDGVLHITIRPDRRINNEKNKSSISQSYNSLKKGVEDFVDHGRQYIHDNKTEIKGFAKQLKNVGDVSMAAGYATTLTGVGALPGAEIYAFGEGVSAVGDIIDFAVDVNEGKYKSLIRGKGMEVLQHAIVHSVTKLIPEGDLLSREIIKQNIGIKFMGANRVIDMVEEKKDK